MLVNFNFENFGEYKYRDNIDKTIDNLDIYEELSLRANKSIKEIYHRVYDKSKRAHVLKFLTVYNNKTYPISESVKALSFFKAVVTDAIPNGYIKKYSKKEFVSLFNKRFEKVTLKKNQKNSNKKNNDKEAINPFFKNDYDFHEQFSFAHFSITFLINDELYTYNISIDKNSGSILSESLLINQKKEVVTIFLRDLVENDIYFDDESMNDFFSNKLYNMISEFNRKEVQNKTFLKEIGSREPSFYKNNPYAQIFREVYNSFLSMDVILENELIKQLSSEDAETDVQQENKKKITVIENIDNVIDEEDLNDFIKSFFNSAKNSNNQLILFLNDIRSIDTKFLRGDEVKRTFDYEESAMNIEN